MEASVAAESVAAPSPASGSTNPSRLGELSAQGLRLAFVADAGGDPVSIASASASSPSAAKLCCCCLSRYASALPSATALSAARSFSSACAVSVMGRLSKGQDARCFALLVELVLTKNSSQPRFWFGQYQRFAYGVS